MSTSRIVLAATAILLACVVISVPVAELAFRLAGVIPADQTAAVFRPFGSGSYRVRARAMSREDWASGPFWIYSDDLGLRCTADGTPSLRAGDHIDTLVLGDSQAFGLGLDYERTVVGVMAGLAAQEGRIVANAAVGGHFLRNQLEVARMLHDEQHLTFDRVAILLSSDRVATPEGYSTARVSEDGRLFGADPDAAARARLWIRTNLAIWGVVRGAYHNKIARHERSEEAPLEQYRRSNAPRFEEAWRRELRAGAEWAKSAGTRLIVVQLSDAYDFEVDAAARAHGAAWSDIDSDTPAAVWRKVCGELGIPLIEVRPALEPLKAQGKLLHLGSDFHYNADTSAVAGRFIWQALSADEPRSGK